MELQLIDKQSLLFRVKNREFHFVKPFYLMPKNEFTLIKARLKGTTLVFNICGGQVSYNQIRKTLTT